MEIVAARRSPARSEFGDCDAERASCSPPDNSAPADPDLLIPRRRHNGPMSCGSALSREPTAENRRLGPVDQSPGGPGGCKKLQRKVPGVASGPHVFARTRCLIKRCATFQSEPDRSLLLAFTHEGDCDRVWGAGMACRGGGTSAAPVVAPSCLALVSSARARHSRAGGERRRTLESTSRDRIRGGGKPAHLAPARATITTQATNLRRDRPHGLAFAFPDAADEVVE